MSRKFTNHELVMRIVRGHAHWKRFTRGTDGKIGFTAHYLERQGFCSPIFRVIRDGRIDALLADCPPAVRRDWSYRPREYWTRERTLCILAEYYRRWSTDDENGKRAGIRWSRAYLRRFSEGKALLRSVDVEPVRVEAYLRALGGSIFADWHRHRYPWDPERLRERIRLAHQRWQTDSVNGKPAGGRFNYRYLVQHSGLEIVSAARDHYCGGIQRFIRTVPEAAADWKCRRHLTHTLVRDEVCVLYRQWLRDSRGRAVSMPFGTAYFRICGKEALLQYVLRHGRGRVLRGEACSPIRRAIGVLPPGFRSREMRRQRAALREAKHVV